MYTIWKMFCADLSEILNENPTYWECHWPWRRPTCMCMMNISWLINSFDQMCKPFCFLLIIKMKSPWLCRWYRPSLDGELGALNTRFFKTEKMCDWYIATTWSMLPVCSCLHGATHWSDLWSTFRLCTRIWPLFGSPAPLAPDFQHRLNGSPFWPKSLWLQEPPTEFR